MKKLIFAICLILGISSLAYAAGSFCCGDGKTKEQCCAEKGKMYCPNDNSCRTRCLKVTPPECIGGCINPEGVCCAWCPSMEVCEAMGKCQKIVDGCYQCVECPEPNPCTENQCMNEDGVCCDSCPRVCPEGECLVNVKGCYECGSCGGDDDDDDDGCSPPCSGCSACINGSCIDQTTTKWTGECCDEGTVECCPLTENCECIPDVSCDTEPTEPDLCEGKDKYKDCCECDSSTGAYTKGCTTGGEKTACCNDVEAYNPNTHECCNNKVYEKCEEGKVRNKETCECECPAEWEACSEECCSPDEVCCNNGCVDFTGCPNSNPANMDENCNCLQCDEAGGEKECGEECYHPETEGCCAQKKYDKETQDCCGSEVYTKAEKECCGNELKDPCPNGQVRNSETCACECTSSSQCGSGQECCGGKCIEKCSATACEKCDSSAQACVKDEANCGNCKNEWSAADCYESQSFECLGTCYVESTQTGQQYYFTGINSCSGVDVGNSSTLRSTTIITRGCCEKGKVVCGPSNAQVCCDACNADNTGCCEADKTCGSDENKICCGEKETCCGNMCCEVCDNEGEGCCADMICGTSCCEVCNADNTGCCDGTICGASCCDENGCNEDETGCAVCKKGEKVCGAGENTWCCSESTECGKTTGECDCSGMMFGQTCCHHYDECSICNAYEKEASSDFASFASANSMTGNYRYEGCTFVMMDYGEQEWACLCGGSYEEYDDGEYSSWASDFSYYPKLQ